MWIITVRSPDTTPIEYAIKAQINTIGRSKKNDIVIPDEASSRRHAQINFNAESGALSIRDLGSKNGTFINRHRLTENIDIALSSHDTIRIGSCEMLVRIQSQNDDAMDMQATGFQSYSRELLIESFDNHAVLLYEVIQQLNKVMNIDVVLKQVTQLVSKTLGADSCQVVLEKDFNDLGNLGFPSSIAKYAIDKQSTVLLPDRGPEQKNLLGNSAQNMQIHTLICAPIILKEKTIALIYIYKSKKKGRLFNQQDVQLAVAVGHLTALSIERVDLMNQVQEEHRIRQFLQRFVAPTEAEFLLRNYLDTGSLPELQEMNSTVLFADIEGSSRMAEEMGPKAFGKLLNRYYQEVTDIIFEHGGLLDKYLGDGFMAVFGMNKSQKLPEESAVWAALGILKLIKDKYSASENHIQVGIGINSGSIVAGYVSTRERLELSVLGDTVNVASRLEGLARPNRILIGPETYQALNGKFSTSSLGDKNLKGRTQPISVHEVFPQ